MNIKLVGNSKAESMRRRLLRLLAFVSVLTFLILALSGRWLDPWLWAYGVACAVFGLFGLSSINDDLARERFHPPNAGADWLALRAIRLIALAHVVVGALDSGRWHLAPVNDGLRIGGLAGMLVFLSLIVLAIRANRFFSPVVRIQDERGHHVIANGPYAIIRHPGYAGMILTLPCSGLALGSWLSVALALVYSALILRRVMFEDRFLRKNLEGYSQYAERVRYRLVPYAW
jgi:protein-S-isoprenylcysteine O-methyltransferase Ste14